MRVGVRHGLGGSLFPENGCLDIVEQNPFEFGPFRVDPGRETLLEAGVAVPLTPKTFQILLVLVRHGQEIVTKDDLMKSVWPDTFVEEANLAQSHDGDQPGAKVKFAPSIDPMAPRRR